MLECSFCGFLEDKDRDAPICVSCGSLRYPVGEQEASQKMTTPEKLKYSAIAAITILTPGALIVLALISVRRLNANKKR